ncbi:Glutaredoxin 4 [Commensalibacter sp. Nvir]|uniref:Grx4 family monothiol glutaredoxin n=1 Tax=Commensalibacter sp. Nvir TaxID=3069817 RepID=UPI002D3B45C8|nr:Glutaredoxin 4 [Commensalibacter sp. Nvir]
MSYSESELKTLTHSNPVVLFLKGTSDFPSCGFSAKVVHILADLGVAYKDINVLEDNELREKMKDFSQWPTFPQLYIKGELIGGCDIVRELYNSGELSKLLKSKGIDCK